MPAATHDRLKNKIAFVTGAANGIGQGIARRFLDEGATVIGADIAFDGAPVELREGGAGRHYVMNLDVGDGAQVRAGVAAIRDRFGRIDVCVSNAALIHAEDFLDISEEDFNRSMRVNLNGVFLCGQACARVMVETGTGGAIVNMSSCNAVLAHANLVPYCASKGAVNQLTKTMALSLAKKGVRVNAIGPGSIATEMLKTMMQDEAASKKVMSRTPMGRLGEVDEIAATAVFLACDESSYITGQTIYADGGRLPLGYTV
jgi:glucose 1-dehydrogenase